MELPAHKREFLIKYHKRLLERTFLIDTMTQVGGRPVLPLYESEAITPERTSITIHLKQPAEDRVYIPLREEDTQGNPILTTVREQNLALVYPFREDIFYLLFQYRNYLALPEEQRAASDAFSKEHYNKTNQELFDYFTSERYLETHFRKYQLQEGDTFLVSTVGSDQSCLVYLSGLNYEKMILTLTYLDNGMQRVLGEIDTFELHPGELPNCNTTVTTTVGRFLLNYLLLVHPFGDLIPYQNDVFPMEKVEEQIAKGMLDGTIQVSWYKQYVNNLYFIGHFTELCVPTYSRKCLTTDPRIKQVKQELLEKYKDRLNDPNVIMEIENTLIQMDKDYLQGDPSMRFYGPLGDKPFNISRKKMYLTVGGVEEFSKTTGNFVFIPNSLSEGMTAETMPAMANETRKGSFNRGDQTKLGGALTKRITRVLQDLVITEHDCKTTRGLTVDFSRFKISRYLGSYIQDGANWVLLTEENKDKFNGKVCLVRSPMYCEAQQGLCYMCMGEIYAKRDAKHLALDAVDITSTFTTDALKSMHGTKISTYQIEDLNQFVLN